MGPDGQEGAKIADSGDLMEVPFARVFYFLCRQRRTARLDIRDKPGQEGGKVLKRILMMEGTSFFVQGGSIKETLGQILLDRGKLSPEQYESLKKEAGGNHGKIEQKILSGAVIAPAEISELLAYQTGLKIKILFSLIRGHYEVTDQPRDQLVSNPILVSLSPEKLVMEGVREFYPPARINKEFPGIEKKTFSRAADFKDRLTALGLSPGVLRWLRTLPPSFSWASIQKSAPKGENHASSVLLGLYFAEAISLPEEDFDFPVGRAYLGVEEAARVEKKAAPEKAEKEEKPAVVKEKKPEEPKLPIEEMLDRQMSDDELVKEIDRLLGIALSSKSTYFDILGVEEKTPGAKIKQIYFKFAKRFHPDAKPDLYQGEVKDKVEDLFTKISEAYNVLGDNEARASYVSDLKSKLSKDDMDKASKAIEAEMEFQKSEILLKRGNWKGAAELLERSVQLQPDEPEYGMYLAWANYRIEGPSGANAARRTIKKVVEQRPKAADGYFYLGHISKAEGMIDEAYEYFLKASSMKPHDVEIKRELQLIQRQRERAAAAPKKGGLFGRKK